MSTTPEYSPLADTPDWRLLGAYRSRQHLAGIVTMVLMVLTLTILIDGLTSQMRGGGSFRIELIAGTSEPVSGPMGAANPRPDDLAAVPIPMDAPVDFEFIGFFSSYWFGTGMWRGSIHAREDAESGTYGMAVGMRSMPASTYQTYTVVIARSQEELNSLSYSFFRRWTGLNPFIASAFLGAMALAGFLGGFMLGQRCDRIVRDLGLAEVFKTRPDGEFLKLFTVTGNREVEGKGLVVYDQSLKRLGKVIYEKTAHGVTETLFVGGDHGVPTKGAFVAFWERTLPESTPPRRGLVSGLLPRKDCASPAQEQRKDEDGAC